MATIGELETAIKKQFPKGIKTTLQKMQLSYLVNYTRVLRNVNAVSNEIDGIMAKRYAVLIKNFRKYLDKEGAEYSLERTKRQIKTLFNEANRLNIPVEKMVNDAVKEIGPSFRDQVTTLYDDFSLGLDEGNARVFFDKAGEYRTNLTMATIHNKEVFGGLKLINDDSAKRVNKRLAEFAATGEAPKGLIKDIQEDLNINRTSAKRLVRTEMIASANATALDEFKAHGTEKVAWSAAFDSNTCPICFRLNGRIWPIDDKARKVPPAHPNCRCTLLPIPTDDIFIDEDLKQGLNQEGEKETGQKFLEGKSDKFLQNALGSKYKADLFKQGVPLRKIVTSTGHVKGDTELRDFIGRIKNDKQLKRFFGDDPGRIYRIKKSELPKKPILKKQKVKNYKGE
jgi:SPP1 gp7 family putative phage head morphogenesis protein